MSTQCLYDGQLCIVSLSCGEDLEFATGTLVSKFEIPQSSVLIHCLKPYNQGYKQVITRVPSTLVPQTLYLYSIPVADYLVIFSRVMVSDSSIDYPETQLVIGKHEQIAQLDRMFKIAKGYDQSDGITYTRGQSQALQQLSLHTLVSELGSDPKLVARRRDALVKVISQGRTLEVARVSSQHFNVPASQLLAKKFKFLSDNSDLSSKHVVYKEKTNTHDQQMVISPERESQISIHIMDKSLQDSRSYSLAKNQSCGHQSSPTHSPSFSVAQNVNMSQCSQRLRYYNVRAMVDFKNTKSQLRQALEIKDECIQDARIKDLIVAQLGLCLQY